MDDDLYMPGHAPIACSAKNSPLKFGASASNSGSENFTLRSDDFENNGRIPPRFTCDGEDVSPHLAWSNPPTGVKSYALSVVDPDAPGGTFIHWLVYNIPVQCAEIERGRLPPGAVEVENDFGRRGYGGPCPPYGTHRYIFTLHALNVERLEGVMRRNFFQKVGEKTIAKATLTGLYSRR